MSLPAMCPRCGGQGCDVCVDGMTEFRFATGAMYTRRCVLCGFENGGRIVGEGLPPLPAEPDISYCVDCGGQDCTEWALVGMSGDDA